jgi:uncharacterized C2H2 Zn-finger protein
MAREIVVQSWCDVCLKRNDVRTPATWSGEITIGSTRQLDLCDEHAEPVRSMVEILDDYGTSTEPPRRRRRRRTDDDAGTLPCPECGKTFATPQGLGAHRSRSHGYRSPARDTPTLDLPDLVSSELD